MSFKINEVDYIDADEIIVEVEHIETGDKFRGCILLVPQEGEE